MTRYSKMYNSLKEKIVKKIESKNDNLNREGYGYIKRRVGLLSSEIGKPTYYATKESS